MQFLEEKGWGSSEADQSAETMLTCEEGKIWELMNELKIDHETFGILPVVDLQFIRFLRR